VTFNLPSSIAVGQTIDLYLADGQAPVPQEPPILTITGAPADDGEFEVLIFASGNGQLPPGVDIEINQQRSELTVNEGVGQQVTIIVEVYGAAGLLKEKSDTFTIVD
jgi:hypothetical protein